MSFPDRPEAPAVETKVKWAATAAFLALSALLYVLDLVMTTPVLISPLPDWLEPPAVGMLPAVAALLAGYLAKHTARPDLPDHKR